MFFALFFLQISFGALAQENCFSDRAEYDVVKSKLPVMLQDLPVYFTAKNIFVAAVGSIQFENGDLRFFFNCTREIKKPIEDRVTICATDDEVQFIFDNKVVEKVAVLGPEQVKIRGKLALDKATKAQFISTSKIVDEKLSGVVQRQNTPSGSFQ